MQRQKTLFARNPPVRLVTVLGEGTLTRPVGGEQVMKGQIEHLRRLSREDTVDVRVLPFSVGAHAAMAGAFRILEFDDPDDPANFPRCLTLWRANLLGSSSKGHEYFLRHILGVPDAAVRNAESPPDQSAISRSPGTGSSGRSAAIASATAPCEARSLPSARRSADCQPPRSRSS